MLHAMALSGPEDLEGLLQLTVLLLFGVKHFPPAEYEEAVLYTSGYKKSKTLSTNHRPDDRAEPRIVFPNAVLFKPRPPGH